MRERKHNLHLLLDRLPQHHSPLRHLLSQLRSEGGDGLMLVCSHVDAMVGEHELRELKAELLDHLREEGDWNGGDELGEVRAGEVADVAEDGGGGGVGLEEVVERLEGILVESVEEDGLDVHERIPADLARYRETKLLGISKAGSGSG